MKMMMKMMMMEAVPCRLVFLAVFFGSRVQQTEGLQCYCHRCPNHTCTTDGLCYVSITRAGSLTTQQSWCIGKGELVPPDRPFVCAPSTKDDSGIYPLCCDTDWCNKDPDIKAFPVPTQKPPALGPVAFAALIAGPVCVCVSAL